MPTYENFAITTIVSDILIHFSVMCSNQVIFITHAPVVRLVLDGLLLRLILRIQNVFVKCILFTYIVCHSITASAVKSFSIICMKVFKTKLQRNANKNFNHLFVFSRAVNTINYNRRELQAYSIWNQIQKVQVFDWKCRSLKSSFMNMPTKWIMLTLSWT